MRFDRARRLLARRHARAQEVRTQDVSTRGLSSQDVSARHAGIRPGGLLADLAADCGYYDQAHLAREFRDLAGCPPSQWLAEEFRNVQAALCDGWE
jgi:AraC-like DNA-binding protein